MELIERDAFLSLMHEIFIEISTGEGHCLLVTGEAGIGKTSLVKAFCRTVDAKCKVYQGTCDALFSPRPLGPILDILWQFRGLDAADTISMSDRSVLFSRFYSELVNQEETTIIVIEDIHWADEATLDFIKFFARRIGRLHCLLILTYRDNEIARHHPIRNVVGQLPPDTFRRMQLAPLSRQAVEKLSVEKGQNGENVYAISGGNPFYVNEILANYSVGVPANIRDSVLLSFNRLDEKTKQIWELLSVMPTGIESDYLEKLDSLYIMSIENCLAQKILIPQNGMISFKHELYRRTIEDSLSPLKRRTLNKRILDLLMEGLEENVEVERIIHHAKNANEDEIVVKYSPLAARNAVAVGAHVEAAKLYRTAIEYYQGNDTDTLIQFYESYAYECYLTNQIKEAIIYTGKALRLWKSKNDIENAGSCMRFLSRLWWYDGNRKNAEMYAREAIETLSDPERPSPAQAMAFSNMSQLRMLAYDFNECIKWGEKAIEMATILHNDEILCHAFNNVGTTLSRIVSSRPKGMDLLQRSLDLALHHSYDEHAARAYTNLASNAVKMKDYKFGKKILDEGIRYCEERDLESYSNYLLAFKARLNLETGNWIEARRISDLLLKNENQPSVVKIEALVVGATIGMRRGDTDPVPLLLDAKEKAFETMEPQRIIPTVTAMLEYEWISGICLIKNSDLDYAITLLNYEGNISEQGEFVFWLLKSKNQIASLKEVYDGYKVDDEKTALKASELWKELGCPYEQALTLFCGNENHKRTAIEAIHKLGAIAIYEKMKFEMRASGIKSIPRGTRKSTQSNPANLTDRELDVLQLLKDGLQNKEVAAKLFISPKTVDHHISSIFFKLEVNSRAKAVQEADRLHIIK